MASTHTFCMLVSQPELGFRDYPGSHQINIQLHTVNKVLGKKNAFNFQRTSTDHNDTEYLYQAKQVTGVNF